MSERAWIRYWTVGWVLGPVVAAYGLVSSDVSLTILGIVVLAIAIAMTFFWRSRGESPQP